MILGPDSTHTADEEDDDNTRYNNHHPNFFLTRSYLCSAHIFYSPLLYVLLSATLQVINIFLGHNALSGEDEQRWAKAG